MSPEGDVLLHGASNNYVRSDSRLVTGVGIADLVIVETADAVMVGAKDRVQDVKKVVEALLLADRPEATQHQTVWRPWGSYESLVVGEQFQVKRLTVQPGQVLSLQLHHHRAEHWVVVSGSAEVIRGRGALYVRAGRIDVYSHRSETPAWRTEVLTRWRS
jgi:hypothetical protein